MDIIMKQFWRYFWFYFKQKTASKLLAHQPKTHFSFKKKRPKIDQNIPNFWFKIGLLCLNPDALLLHRLQKCSSQIVIVKEHMHICTKMHNSSFAYIYSVRFITYLKKKSLTLLRGRQDFGRSAKSVECRKNMTRWLFQKKYFSYLQWTTMGPSVSLEDCDDFWIKANNCPAVSGVPWSGQAVYWKCNTSLSGQSWSSTSWFSPSIRSNFSRRTRRV